MKDAQETGLVDCRQVYLAEVPNPHLETCKFPKGNSSWIHRLYDNRTEDDHHICIHTLSYISYYRYYIILYAYIYIALCVCVTISVQIHNRVHAYMHTKTEAIDRLREVLHDTGAWLDDAVRAGVV